MKTGKIHTSGSYDQSPEGNSIRIAQWDPSAASHDEELGMVRYNTVKDRVEVYTMQGWRHILTSNDVVDKGGGDSLKQGIVRKVQAAKKMKQVSMYFQGNSTQSHGNLINYTSQTNQDTTMPSWLTKVTPSSTDGTNFVSKLNNEGEDVLLFVDDGTKGVNGCMLYIDVPELLGIDDSDKYTWKYSVISGLNGYGVISRYSSDLNANIKCLASHDAPSPDLTPNNDTSPNYGRFTAICRFQYGTQSTKVTAYNGNFNLLVMAKKFKGF